jgi:MFS family permease
MTIQSIFGVGAILGTFIIPILSDLWGRWFATNASLLSMLFGNLFILLGTLSGSYKSIGIGMFLSAFGSLAMDAISYSLSTDFLVGETKQKAVIYFYAIW